MKESKIAFNLAGHLFWVMTILLLILRIVGIIDWAWWQCFLPLLLPIAIGLSLAGICFILFMVCVIVEVSYQFIRKKLKKLKK